MRKNKSSSNYSYTPATHPDAALETANVKQKSKHWNFIQNDLEKALGTWHQLEQLNAELSPDEQQFRKIKTLIGQLKRKIEQF